MSYLEELKPESPAVTLTRPDVQGVTIILPEGGCPVSMRRS